MLILARKKEESLIINGNIEIKVLEASDGKVKLGIIAPKEVEVHRKEIYSKILSENQESMNGVKAVRKLISSKKSPTE